MPRSSRSRGRCPESTGAAGGTTRVASAVKGTKKLDQECLAQPGSETLTCRSPGIRPLKYIEDRCPTGYDAWVWTTSFGAEVVPEVK